MKSILLVIAGVAILLAPSIQTTGDPGAGYTWSLGDLATPVDYSSRLDIDWDTGEWADPYDTEAELLALGWDSTTITAANCAATGDDADESTVATQIEEACDPSGATNGDCENMILKFEASCTYDMTSGSGGSAFGGAGMHIPYSNVAYVGGGMTSTYIACNDTATADSGPRTCVANNISDDNEAGTGTTFTWTGGIVKGAGSDTASNAIVLTESCGNLAVGDYVKLVGTTAQSVSTSIYNRIAALDSTSGCKVQLEDPLRASAIATPVSLRETIAQFGTSRISNVYFMDMQIGFPNLPDGACSSDTGSNIFCGQSMRLSWINGALVTRMWLGPYGQQALITRANHRLSIRSSKFGDCQMCKRRGTRGGIISNNADGGSYSVFDNYTTAGAKRLITVAAQSAIGGYQGFNYEGGQAATSPETGSHCDGVGNPQGIAIWAAQSPATERGLFLGHSSIAGQGGFLIEANDIECQMMDETGAVGTPEYGTLYRNRATRTNGTLSFAGSASQHYRNWIGNRFTTWNADGGRQPNALGLWNVGTSAIATPSGSGVTWPTSSTGKNYVDASEHDDSATVNLPPSLAFRQDSPPDWWCRESGTWAALGDDDTAFSFGYADGYLGTTHMLPAQIRANGTTCTPP